MPELSEELGLSALGAEIHENWLNLLMCSRSATDGEKPSYVRAQLRPSAFAVRGYEPFERVAATAAGLDLVALFQTTRLAWIL